MQHWCDFPQSIFHYGSATLLISTRGRPCATTDLKVLTSKQLLDKGETKQKQKKENKTPKILLWLNFSEPPAYILMTSAFPLYSCSLSFTMIICLRVFRWTLASLPSLRLLLCEPVLPVGGGGSKWSTTKNVHRDSGCQQRKFRGSYCCTRIFTVTFVIKWNPLDQIIGGVSSLTELLTN